MFPVRFVTYVPGLYRLRSRNEFAASRNDFAALRNDFARLRNTFAAPRRCSSIVAKRLASLAKRFSSHEERHSSAGKRSHRLKNRLSIMNWHVPLPRKAKIVALRPLLSRRRMLRDDDEWVFSR